MVWLGESFDWASVGTIAVALSATPNTPATGKPTIRGTPTLGLELESEVVGNERIADANGLSNAVYTYQWVPGRRRRERDQHSERHRLKIYHNQ